MLWGPGAYGVYKCKNAKMQKNTQSVRSQTEHSGDPLGDPSARVFEVFLIVLDGVQGETLWGGNPARATTLMSESERQGNRQSSGQLSSSDA